jgi:hypothetical protein
MYFQIPILFNQNNKSMYLQIPKLVSSIKITMSDTKFNLMKRTIHVSSDTKGNLMNRIKQKPIRHVTSYTPITYIVCWYKTLHQDKFVVWPSITTSRDRQRRSPLASSRHSFITKVWRYNILHQTGYFH